MRARATGSRPSAADPSSLSQSVLTCTPAKKRLCFYCDFGEARMLPVQLPDVEGPMFCSMVCAAKCGVENVKRYGVHWCELHQQWAMDSAPCLFCSLESSSMEVKVKIAKLLLVYGQAVRHG